MGDSVENNFPRCRLGPLNRVLLRVAVQEHVQFRHFGNPTPIDFAVKLDRELHCHSLPSPMRSGGLASGGASMVVDQKGNCGPLLAPLPQVARFPTTCPSCQLLDGASSRGLVGRFRERDLTGETSVALQRRWVVGAASSTILFNMAFWRNKKIKGQNPQNEKVLLYFVDSVTIPATSGDFNAKSKFVVTASWNPGRTNDSALVKINWVGNRFQIGFLGGGLREWHVPKTEKPVGETTLRYYDFRKPPGPQTFSHAAIIEELGGSVKAQTSLRELFYLMEKQASGSPGPLRNAPPFSEDYGANYFYVENVGGDLEVIEVSWAVANGEEDHGWFVESCKVETPIPPKGRVFSHN